MYPSMENDTKPAPTISHSEQERRKLSSFGQKFFELIEFDEDETIICEIRKHPIGMFFIYVMGIGIAAILFGIATAISYFIPEDVGAGVNVDLLRAGILVLGIILAGFSLVTMFIGIYIYRASVLFVTSEKIAQVLYKTIFNRKISQISLGEIQDVTVTQNGFIPRVFNFGTLVVETAGEQNNYLFEYVPFPYQCAKDIVGAHEASIKQYGN